MDALSKLLEEECQLKVLLVMKTDLVSNNFAFDQSAMKLTGHLLILGLGAMPGP